MFIFLILIFLVKRPLVRCQGSSSIFQKLSEVIKLQKLDFLEIWKHFVTISENSAQCSYNNNNLGFKIKQNNCCMRKPWYSKFGIPATHNKLSHFQWSFLKFIKIVDICFDLCKSYGCKLFCKLSKIWSNGAQSYPTPIVGL